MNDLKRALLLSFILTTACVPTWDEFPSNSYIPPHYYNQYSGYGQYGGQYGYNPYMSPQAPRYAAPQGRYPSYPQQDQDNLYTPFANSGNGFQSPPMYSPQDNDQSYYFNYQPQQRSNRPLNSFEYDGITR
jgi:hypothetical protein